MTTQSAGDSSGASQRELVPFETDLPQPPRPTSPVLVGGAAGAAVALAAMFVYHLLRIGWLVAHDLTRQAGAADVADSPDRVFGVLVLGALLSLAPAVLAGGLLGAVLGWFLTATRTHQGPLRAWLSGSVLTYLVAVLVNATVLLRHRAQALTFIRWSGLIGIPSVLYVLVFGGVAVYLHLRLEREDLGR